MQVVEDRNYLAGCLALLLVAGALFWLATRDPDAGGRAERAAAIRDDCIRAGRASFQARHPGAVMSRRQEADLVSGCFREARLRST